MNGLKKTETNTSIFFFFAGFFNFLCPSICLLVCIFFCLHPSHLCLGVSWVFSMLSTTDPSSTLLSLMVRLVSRGSDLPARGRRSLSSLLTSGLLYRSVRWDWSLSSAAWRSCLSCSITLSLQHNLDVLAFLKYILLQYCIDYGWLNMSVAFRVCCYIMHKLCLVVDSDTIFHPIKTWLYSYHKWYDFLKSNFKEWMYIYKKWISILKIHWVMNYNINDFTLAYYFQEVHLKLKFIYY